MIDIYLYLSITIHTTIRYPWPPNTQQKNDWHAASCFRPNPSDAQSSYDRQRSYVHPRSRLEAPQQVHE